MAVFDPLFTFEQAEEELTLRLGNRRDISARTASWLDAAQLRIAQSLIELPSLETSLTFDAVEDQSEYDLTTIIPPPSDLIGIKFVTRQENQAATVPNLRMIRFPFVEFRSLVNQASSPPVRWCRYGTTFAVDPMPDGLYPILLEYRRRPRYGISELDSVWHEDWIKVAEFFAWQALLQPDMAKAAFDMISLRIQALIQTPLDQDQWEAAFDVNLGVRMMGRGW